ncbi:PspA/IM30 family protein [Paramaledivibacter caminithermalis]|jgi:phage shock protein A|uniref:Phage shock protein A (PspA) family protein n=1 Tax=Paramaledivibacter caminithermalis (strain DSM 15212 / CIP 107654 / DViRD3) TaxID=1121301 RepID=A0A1M6S7X9_PARC5|nr:PspA/IM30 family protein [Paramaledivibacter caminithermalis]SHK40813.1 phage shock protein A (PspA) family protein [Paramaledivibacter caminithermalis DSM 15212]
MGIFNRISTVFKANINDMISKAEDPEKMLNQLIIDMSEQYKKAKVEVASAIADEKRLKKALDEQEAKVADWTKKAELAVTKGDDKLAIAALNRKKEYEDLAQQYRVQWQSQKAATDNLKASLRDLSNKIEEAKRKKGLLIARTKRAEAQKSIQRTMAGLNDNSVFDTFNRMSEKVDEIESQAMAEAELNEAMAGDDIEKQFHDLEQEDSAVMDELAALKAKLGK